MAGGEWLYPNAPLLEVIVELRWEMVQLASMPGAAIDPHFESTARDLKDRFEARGFGVVEALVPPQAPKEFFGGQAVYRFRKQAERWPLYQLGPGVFTANIVPPYPGWSSFLPFITEGFEDLVQSYPAATKLMKVRQISLRYLNAFTRAHGRESQFVFLNDGLGLSLEMPSGFSRQLGLGATPDAVGIDASYTIIDPIVKDGQIAKLLISVKPGRKDNEDATILDTVFVTEYQTVPNFHTSELSEKLNFAHGKLSRLFDCLTTERTKSMLGKKEFV
jgi:uncharacterized protein (TIGR04255 family)